MKLESKIKFLNAPEAHSVSVHSKLPQFARSNQNQRSRPDQIRQPRERICYNCRKPGHLAVSCRKSNPRMEGLCAPRPPKTNLRVRFQNTDPEASSVDVAAEPEVSAAFGTVLVPIQENGFYEPYVYPNGSSNPMLKNYSWAELNRAVTPYRS